MTNHGDDCYYFYSSFCAKGDGCPFRHCEAAMGSEVVCSLWEERRCFRPVCKFRHREMKKNRKQIACYWENQPTGCQKPHCAFHHEKPRFVDGAWVYPANKASDEEEPQEDPSPPAATPLPTAANPQLRGVIKAETQENVPSPTHPPVVINPADDEDEDEDDQFSEEGEDSRTGSDGSRLVSPRKMALSSSSDESLNFGIRTLEEIRLRKARNTSMRRSGHPIGQGSDPAQRNKETSGEKENIRSFVRPSLYLAKDDGLIFGEDPGKHNVAEQLGKRIIERDASDGGADLPLKRRLAERLGRKVDEEDTDLAPPKALKPVRDRLGLPAEEPAVVTEPAFIEAETNSVAQASEEIRIETLEEIRQEKAAKSQGRKDNTRGAAPAPQVTSPTSRASKRVITVKPASKIDKDVQIKTFSEVLHARKKLEEDQHQGQSVRKARQPANEAPDNPQASAGTAVPSRAAPPRGGVRVKTLEKIRKEKAARMQARGKEATNGKPRIMRVNKPASPVAASATTQKPAEEVTEKPVAEKPAEPTASAVTEPSPANGRSDPTNRSLKGKTFEELMREKRLRRQQLQEEEAASSTSQPDVSAKAEPAEKEAAGPALVRETGVTPVRAKSEKVTTPNPSFPSSPTLTLEAPAPAPAPSRAAPPRGGVRVKTLEEIRKEKAARMQARGKEATNGKPRIMRVNKPASPVAASATTQKTAEEVTEKPVAEKPAEPTASAVTEPSPANGRSDPTNRSLKGKTFEEFMREKRLRRQQLQEEEAASSTSPTSRASKRVITVKPASNAQIKTFFEVLHARKKLEEDQRQGQSVRKARQPANEAPDNHQASAGTAVPSRAAPPRGGVRVKTLEEIRKEKAARMQARGKEATNGKGSGTEAGEGKEPRIMRVNKPASPVAASTTTQKTAEEVTEKPVAEKPAEPTASAVPEPSPANGRSDPTNRSLKGKTFEEFMREKLLTLLTHEILKRLRKHHLQEEEAASSTSQPDVSAKAEPAEKEAAGPALVRETGVTPVRAKSEKVTTPNPSFPSSPTLTLEAPAPAPAPKAPSPAKAPSRQRITLKPKAASPVPSATNSPQQGSPMRQAEADSPSVSPRSSTASLGKRKRAPLSPLAAGAPKQAKGASSPGPPAEESPVEKTQDVAQKKSPGQATEAKVRPKLNVRPSVMKPAAQVKPGQKRRAAESPRSAVAAVKPLNSASRAQDVQLQEPPCKQRRVSSPSFSTDAQMSPLVPRSPPTLLGHGPSCSPPREELQTVPVIQHSTASAAAVTTTTSSAATATAVTTTSNTAAREACVVPQSPTAVKSPTLPRPRRASVVTSSRPAPASTSSMDDFDELMNEFTDWLEDDLELDPGKGEDDLLLELLEMIDS